MDSRACCSPQGVTFLAGCAVKYSHVRLNVHLHPCHTSQQEAVQKSDSVEPMHNAPDHVGTFALMPLLCNFVAGSDLGDPFETKSGKAGKNEQLVKMKKW